VGRSPETVRKWLANKEKEEKQAKIKKALELREKGYTQEQIAEELGVSQGTVSKWFQEYSKRENLPKGISLLTPTGDPTPEGIKLFDEHLREKKKR